MQQTTFDLVKCRCGLARHTLRLFQHHDGQHSAGFNAQTTFQDT